MAALSVRLLALYRTVDRLAPAAFYCRAVGGAGGAFREHRECVLAGAWWGKARFGGRASYNGTRARHRGTGVRAFPQAAPIVRTRCWVALARKDLALRHTRNITPHRDKRALLTNGAPIRCRRVPPRRQPAQHNRVAGQPMAAQQETLQGEVLSELLITDNEEIKAQYPDEIDDTGMRRAPSFITVPEERRAHDPKEV